VSAATGPHDAGLDVLAATRSRRRVPARLLRLASDERLVDMLRSGSEGAFEALFDRHHRGVLGFCRHMLGSVEEGEDAVQHTFLAAYRELTATDKPIQFRPWLFAIARNRCLTVLRTRSRQSVGELEEPPTEHLAAEVERRHELRALLGDVARLPEEQRAALVLSELGDMPHEEIADVLGCRREKVKALVFQARTSLIASKTARETSCAEIRELLANLSGGSLRRNHVRRHVAECAGCRAFRDEVRRQRRELAVVLPVAPTVGLKAGILGSAASSAVATSAIATKVLIVAAVVGSGTAALEVKAVVDRPSAPPPAATRAAPVKATTHQAAVSAHRHVPAVAPRSHPAGAPKPAAPAATTRPRGPVAKANGHVKAHHHRHGAPAAAGPMSHPAHPAHPAKPVHPAHPAQSARPSKAVMPAKSSKPVAPPGQAKVAPPRRPKKVTPPVKAAQPVKPVRAAAHAKAVKATPPGQAKKTAG
jgi:RNA polymerase sigma factor (sigma-70 family)